MTTYSAGTILLLDFPNTDGAQGKPRPGLVIFDTGDDDVIVARITSHIRRSAYEIPLAEWMASGLRLPSIVRIHKLASMHKSKIRRTIGMLTPADYRSVAGALRSLLADW